MSDSIDRASTEGPVSKRRFLQTISALGAAGLAGCAGDEGESPEDGDDPDPSDDDGSDAAPDEEFDWPPAGNNVDVVIPHVPGGSTDLGATWASYAERHYPDDVRVNPTWRPGAEGLIGIQEVHGATPDGGTLLASNLAGILTAHSETEGVSLDDFRWLASMFQSVRTIPLVPNSRPIERNWELEEWEEIREMARDETFTVASAVPDHSVMFDYLLTQDPELSSDDFQIVSFDGWGAVQGAAERGEIDTYPTLITLSYTERDELLKDQFIPADPDFTPELYESYQGWESGSGDADDIPDNAWLPNQDDYPSDAAENVARIFIGGNAAALPPGTPDNIYDIHEEAWEEAEADEERHQQVASTYSEQMDVPIVGEEETTDFIWELQETREGDELYNELVEEHFG